MTFHHLNSKSKLRFNIFFLVAFLLVISSESLQAQITTKLFNALTDTLRPKERQHVTLQEMGYILREYYSIQDISLRTELSHLATIYGPKYSTITDINERAKYLNDLSWFWYQRSLPDSVEKYSKLTLSEAKLFPSIDVAKVAYARKIQGYLKMDRDDLSGAYADFQSAIELFRSVSEREQISDCFSGILMIFQKLQLHDKVIAGADTTLTFITKNSKKVFQEHLKIYLFLMKARAYTTKFSDSHDPSNADSAKLILLKIAEIQAPHLIRWRIEAFTELSRLSFYQKKYHQSISFADSAFAMEGPSILENTNKEVRMVYKGLSLMETGELISGLSLLTRVNRKGDAEYTGVLLTRLYEYESARQNYRSALQYHTELLQFIKRSQLMNHRGRIFELEKKYDILLKDLQINRLQKKEQGFFRIGMIVLAMLIAGGLFFANRYRIIRNKTRTLISQLNDLTDLQMIRVEDAENRIRKKIAQDLHDDFASSIAASTQFLQVRALHEANPEDQRKLHSVINILHESYRKARTMSHQIYYDEGEAKFWDGLVDHATLFFSGSTIELSVNVESEGLILPVEIKVAILLIVKEAIVNILKHSSATQVQILFYKDLAWLNLEVIDNGKGMNLSNKKGIGLDSIAERVTSVQGQFSILNLSKGGTALRVSLPFPV